MRWLLLMFLALASSAAWSEGIGEVLERSQKVRMEAHPEVDAAAPSAVKIRASFQTVLRSAGQVPPLELKVVTGAPLAETLQGHVIVVDESLAEAREADRQFVLAHELGHVVLKHWPQMRNLYQAYIPGEVVRSHTDSVAGPLGSDASKLAYKQEFEADLFAMRMLRSMGHPPEEACQALMQQGVQGDTATHPGTMKRVTSLRHAAAEDARR
jgi:Zn-dependent protease with chaperone function